MIEFCRELIVGMYFVHPLTFWTLIGIGVLFFGYGIWEAVTEYREKRKDR